MGAPPTLNAAAATCVAVMGIAELAPQSAVHVHRTMIAAQGNTAAEVHAVPASQTESRARQVHSVAAVCATPVPVSLASRTAESAAPIPIAAPATALEVLAWLRAWPTAVRVPATASAAISAQTTFAAVNATDLLVAARAAALVPRALSAAVINAHRADASRGNDCRAVNRLCRAESHYL